MASPPPLQSICVHDWMFILRQQTYRGEIRWETTSQQHEFPPFLEYSTMSCGSLQFTLTRVKKSDMITYSINVQWTSDMSPPEPHSLSIETSDAPGPLVLLFLLVSYALDLHQVLEEFQDQRLLLLLQIDEELSFLP